MLTSTRLRQVLKYVPETGVFLWIALPRNLIAKIGTAAGNLNGDGYHHIMIDGATYKAHRLAWLWMTGEWPTNDTDHRNGIRNDNRWSNLRDVTRGVNQQNQRRARGNSASGFLGVHVTQSNRFQASIRVDGETRYLGQFETPEEAHQAYLETKRAVHVGCTI